MVTNPISHLVLQIAHHYAQVPHEKSSAKTAARLLIVKHFGGDSKNLDEDLNAGKKHLRLPHCTDVFAAAGDLIVKAKDASNDAEANDEGDHGEEMVEGDDDA